MKNTKLLAVIQDLSNQILEAQKEIRILDAIKWDAEIEHSFFEKNCRALPQVDADYYQKKLPLPFNPEMKIAEFYEIEGRIKQKIGNMNPVGKIMMHMCQEYREVIHMLVARGTPQFSQISQTLYGTSTEAFYVNGPTIHDLADLMNQYSSNLICQTSNEKDVKRYDAKAACEYLNDKIQMYFKDHSDSVSVELSDTLVSDAAAGADKIRVRKDAKFSERDLRMLEVHEGWVHLGTTLNGALQKTCTFLSKGTPSTIVTQEGLAVLMEILTFSSFPERVERIISRIDAIHMAEQGANFIDVFDSLRAKNLSKEQAYNRAMRVFRGSTPAGNPFTKDLAYNKGFVLLYNFIRIAIKQNKLHLIPLLFVGKIRLEDIHLIDILHEEGIIQAPYYVPYPINDMAALSCWLCYSLFMNKLDLDRMESDFS